MKFSNPLSTIVVTLKTGQLIKGILVDQSREKLMLRMASVSSVDRNQMTIWTRINGDVVILSENIDWYQLAIDHRELGLDLAEA